MSTVITTTMTNAHYEMKLENGLNGHASIPNGHATIPNGHASIPNGYRKNGHVKQEYRETPVSFYTHLIDIIKYFKLLLNNELIKVVSSTF